MRLKEKDFKYWAPIVLIFVFVAFLFASLAEHFNILWLAGIIDRLMNYGLVAAVLLFLLWVTMYITKKAKIKL